MASGKKLLGLAVILGIVYLATRKKETSTPKSKQPINTNSQNATGPASNISNE